jgi:hypothetical protein
LGYRLSCLGRVCVWFSSWLGIYRLLCVIAGIMVFFVVVGVDSFW